MRREALIVCAAAAVFACASARAGENCTPPVRGLEPFFVSGSTILVGEVHGSAEIPQLLWSMACSFSHAGAPTVVGMEIPAEEQPRIDAYLASSGSAAARQRLLDGAFWKSEFKDGRSSEAVLGLIEHVRAARRSGVPIDFQAVVDHTPNGAYDADIARGIDRVRRRDPDAVMIVSAGNNHTRVDSAGAAGGILRQRGITFTSLDVVTGGGTVWSCGDGCKVHDFESGHPASATWHVDMTPIAGHIWDGTIFIGKVSASLPAHR
jgi:hypothetical protein